MTDARKEESEKIVYKHALAKDWETLIPTKEYVFLSNELERIKFDIEEALQKRDKKITELKARETYLENLGTARFRDMHKVQTKLSKAVEALKELEVRDDIPQFILEGIRKTLKELET